MIKVDGNQFVQIEPLYFPKVILDSLFFFCFFSFLFSWIDVSLYFDFLVMHWGYSYCV